MPRARKPPSAKFRIGCGASSGSFGRRRIRTTARLNPHEFVQLRRGQAPVEETERACVFQLACSVQQTGHCRAIERCRKADALTPAAASSAAENDIPLILIPTMKLTGFDT